MAASDIWEAGGLIRGNGKTAYSNLQYDFGPVGFEYHDGNIKLLQAFAIHVDQLRPRSRGSISLKSGNPYDKPCDKPAPHFDYLAEQGDLDELVEGVHKTRDLVAQPAFDGLRGVELEPGALVKGDAEIREWVRSDMTQIKIHVCEGSTAARKHLTQVNGRRRISVMIGSGETVESTRQQPCKQR